MGADYGMRLPDLADDKPMFTAKCTSGTEPELSFHVRMGDVDMDSGLLTGEEEESELPVANEIGSITGG
jgi:hypothetical protein